VAKLTHGKAASLEGMATAKPQGKCWLGVTLNEQGISLSQLKEKKYCI